MLAAIRPDNQSFALLLHLVGATVVLGALLASASFIVLARGDGRMLRLGYYSLLFVGLPGLILLRLAGEWLYRLQNWNKLPDQFKEPTRLHVGFIVTDWGGLLFLAALALGGVGVYRLRNGKGDAGLLKVTMVIALILIAAYVVAVWAMTGKPS